MNISLNFCYKQSTRIHRQVDQKHANIDIDLSPSGQGELKLPLYI